MTVRACYKLVAMLKSSVSSAVPFLAVAVLASGCVFCKVKINPNPLGKLNGYKYSFPFPRTDIPPGTMVVRWDDGQIDVVCRPADYHTSGDSVVIDSNQVSISQAQSDEIKAKVTANVKDIVNAELGATRVSAIKVDGEFTPKSVVNTGVLLGEVRNSRVCNDSADLLRQIHGKGLRRFEMVRDAAMFTFTYHITVSSEVGVDAELTGKLSTKLDAQASVGGGSSQEITVTARETYTHYNLTLAENLRLGK